MDAKTIRFLSQKDMERLDADNMDLAIEDVKKVYRLYKDENILPDGAKKVTMPDKVVLRFGETSEDEHKYGRINAMPGRICAGEEGLDIAGIKWIGSGPDNPVKRGLPRASALVILNDPKTKLPVCIADATRVSAVRTGAAGAVAAELLARRDAEVLTLCGAGAQGHTQLKAVLKMREGIKKIYVYDMKRESSDKLIRWARENEKWRGKEFIAVNQGDELEAAVRESHIVITATTAVRPFIRGEWVHKGQLLMNISGDEMEPACVEKADKRVVDFWNAVKHRNSSTIARMANTPGAWEKLEPDAELGELLNGVKKLEAGKDSLIYFNAVGAGLLDMVIVARCFERAKTSVPQIGQEIVFWEKPEEYV